MFRQAHSLSWESVNLCFAFLVPSFLKGESLLISHFKAYFNSLYLLLKVRKDFTSDIDSAIAAFRGLSVIPSGGEADLTQLFRIAAHEAKKSRSQNRILRVVCFWTLFEGTNAFVVYWKFLSLMISKSFFS